MVLIKDKIAKMIALANGELVRHCHAVEAGIYGEDNKFESGLKKRRILVNQMMFSSVFAN